MTELLERRWKRVRIPELYSLDFCGLIDDFSSRLQLIKDKYRDCRFGIEVDYDYSSVYAERLETDEEVHRREEQSKRMKKYHRLRKSSKGNTDAGYH